MCGSRSVDEAQGREQGREQPNDADIASHLSTRASSSHRGGVSLRSQPLRPFADALP